MNLASFDTLALILYATLHAATPLLLAGLGELVTEKSGLLNLGVEGTMLVGAIVGFIAALHGDSLLFGFLCAAGAGLLMALCFAVLAITLRANQVAAGLALTIFGIGLSAFLGLEYVGRPLEGLKDIYIAGLSDLPFVGKLLFQLDWGVYFALLATAAVGWFLYRTRAGLILRAVGENHHAAHAMGYSPARVRYCAALFGGAMVGLGGAYLSLAYTPLWTEGMTAGRGWIALALVVFSMWRPSRLLLGAWLFGFVGIAQLFAQGANAPIAPQFLTMLPYLTTIVALTLISGRGLKTTLRPPANLGQPYEPD